MMRRRSRRPGDTVRIEAKNWFVERAGLPKHRAKVLAQTIRERGYRARIIPDVEGWIVAVRRADAQ